MRKIVFASVIALSLIACGGSENKNEENKMVVDMNSSFDTYKTNFIENLWKVYPGWASSQGYHAYDSVLVVPNEESRQKELNFAKANLDSIKSFNLEGLSDNNKTDFYMIENQLNSIVWSINEQKSYEWNPSEYNVCGSFAELLNGNYDSLDVRLRNFYLKMASIPAFYEAAKKNIKNPTLEHTQLAIDQNLGGVSVFETDFHEALNKVKFGEHEKQMMEARAKEATATIKAYAEWLKKLENKTPRSFRLGKELYSKKFEFDIQSGYSADQIFEKAIAHKKELHEKMFELANKLWDKYMGKSAKPEDKLVLIKQVIDKISVKHVKPEEFQSEIEKQIPALVQFIKDKDLIYIDPSKPLVVRKEPDYMAGVAGASISAPGPYDKNGNTYYNVGSLGGWDKERAESYLREYNFYILQILNIHPYLKWIRIYFLYSVLIYLL
jgi:hypothetical protein